METEKILQKIITQLTMYLLIAKSILDTKPKDYYATGYYDAMKTAQNLVKEGIVK